MRWRTNPYIFLGELYPVLGRKFRKVSWILGRELALGERFIYLVTCMEISGVVLPFRDLRQPTRNITYFASVAQKMPTV